MNQVRSEKGITLVALIVTIVVLLILAGITITYIMGDNSVFKQAEKSKLEYNIAKAKEKLEVTFGQAKVPKHTDKKYNQDEYLDELMKKEISNIKIADDIVIIDGYAFEIDRSEPKIGKYVGEEKDLVFPEITVTATLVADSKTATIHIIAKEDTNGISKIEVIQEGHVLETYECGNTKDEVVKDYIAKQNGIYTIKVYAKLVAKENATVDGIVMSLKYTPNGNEEYKKEHQVKVSVNETDDKVKSIKYQWLNTTVEPAESSFTTTCTNGETITKNGVTGTYYLWTLLETESGKINIQRSEGFNFDNQGPTVTLTSTPVSATSFTLTANASDTHSEIAKYGFYIRGEAEPRNSKETKEGTASYTMTGVNTGNTSCYVIVTDNLGNETKKTITGQTKVYVWEKWSTIEICTYDKYKSTSSYDTYSRSQMSSNRTLYQNYKFDNNGCFVGVNGANVRHPLTKGCYLILNYGKSLGIITNSCRYYVDGFTAGEGATVWYDIYQSKVIKRENKKGTTKYSDVTNTNSSAYPNNGYQSGYWYVYKGVQ